MKKILIVHTKYTQKGGEDIAVQKEIDYLKNYYKVETLIFENTLKLKIKEIKAFFYNNNVESLNKFKEKIIKFEPDYVYIHNLWFMASLGILEYSLNENLNVIHKLHNFRYDCTKSFMSDKHLRGEKICKACGLNKSDVGKFNRYYKESFLKSVLVNNFGRKYIKLLKNKKLKIVTLTEHHKNYLNKLGVDLKNIFVQPNPTLSFDKTLSQKNTKLNQIVYAGRISEEKGIKELIKAWTSLNEHNSKLIIIGEGPLLSDLEKKCEKINSIEVLGYKENEEVLKMISASKAVITATKLYEGQPTLLCEASELSVPSIFPDSGGIKDFFPDNYEFKFEQFNYKDLLNKLNKVVFSDYLIEQGKENQKFINEYLNVDNLMKSFDKALEA
mgnify:FL=1|tara:strand:+ start:25 stop:1182 length:1158 start_codon:yes stop_codon:yes gene_type:complete